MMITLSRFRHMMLAATLTAASLPAAADTFIVAVGAASNSLQGRSAEMFATELQTRLGDAHVVEFYADGQLGDERELMQKLRTGTVHFTLLSSVMTTVADEFAIFDLPFLVADRDHVVRLHENLVMTDLAPLAQSAGLEVLSTWENGFRHITNNRRPVTVPADLSGMKLRTPPSEWRVAMFNEYGANATSMAFSELFVALQTGTMDGQENPLTNIDGAGLAEVQKYLSLSNHVYSPTYLTTGARIWGNMPDDVRTAAVEVAAEVQTWSLAEGEAADVALLEKFAAAGMEINEVDRDAFITASAPVYAMFSDRVAGAQDMIDAALALADE
jgi:tripartite ATP-independent transporter DctP family solute receptor